MGIKLNGQIIQNVGNTLKLNNIYPAGLKINGIVAYRHVDNAASGTVWLATKYLQFGIPVGTSDNIADPDGVNNPTYSWYISDNTADVSPVTYSLLDPSYITDATTITAGTGIGGRYIYPAITYTEDIGIERTITFVGDRGYIAAVDGAPVGKIRNIIVHGTQISIDYILISTSTAAANNTSFLRLETTYNGGTSIYAVSGIDYRDEVYNSMVDHTSTGTYTLSLTYSSDNGATVTTLDTMDYTITNASDQAGSGGVSLSGDFIPGGTITADVSGVTDPDGVTEFEYKWLTGDILGGSWSGYTTYTPTTTVPTWANNSNTIQLIYYYKEDDGDIRSVESPIYNIVTNTISGMTKTTTDGWGNCGAESDTAYSGDIDLSFYSTLNYMVVGLSTTSADDNYTSINYGIYVWPNGTINILENGTQVAAPSETVTASDLLRVKRIGNTVTYWKNDTVLYTSTVTNSNPLVVDISIYDNGATVRDIQVNGAHVNLTNINGADTILGATEDIRPDTALATVAYGANGLMTITLQTVDDDSTGDDYTITWGDGSAPSSYYNVPKSGYPMSHTYTANGTYTIEIYTANVGKTPIKRDTAYANISNAGVNGTPTVTIGTITDVSNNTAPVVNISSVEDTGVPVVTIGTITDVGTPLVIIGDVT